MKVIKQVTDTGTINHRDAFFKASLCNHENKWEIIFAVTIRNPVDIVPMEGPDFTRVKDILDGRIAKRFEKGTVGKLTKFTEVVMVFKSIKHLYSKDVLQGMLTQFKRVKQNNLSDDLGLKWNPKEGDTTRELSVETSTGDVQH